MVEYHYIEWFKEEKQRQYKYLFFHVKIPWLKLSLSRPSFMCVFHADLEEWKVYDTLHSKPREKSMLLLYQSYSSQILSSLWLENALNYSMLKYCCDRNKTFFRAKMCHYANTFRYWITQPIKNILPILSICLCFAELFCSGSWFACSSNIFSICHIRNVILLFCCSFSFVLCCLFFSCSYFGEMYFCKETERNVEPVVLLFCYCIYV